MFIVSMKFYLMKKLVADVDEEMEFDKTDKEGNDEESNNQEDEDMKGDSQEESEPGEESGQDEDEGGHDDDGEIEEDKDGVTQDEKKEENSVKKRRRRRPGRKRIVKRDDGKPDNVNNDIFLNYLIDMFTNIFLIKCVLYFQRPVVHCGHPGCEFKTKWKHNMFRHRNTHRVGSCMYLLF